MDDPGAGVRYVNYKLIKSRTKYKKRCFVFKKTRTTTGNSVKYMTTAHAHDTNCQITHPINKHDVYTVPLEPKLGLW